MKLKQEIKNQIRNDVMARSEIVAKKSRINLSLLDEVLHRNDRLRVLGVDKTLQRDTALVVADLAPERNWAHPCRIYLHDSSTGKLYDQINASFPPIQMKRGTSPIERFHTPIKLRKVSRSGATAAGAAAPPLNALANHPGQRYAILFSGDSDNRHLNDLEFLYRTLIDVYDFAPANIRVANHDGTVNYDFAPSPIGNWPGDNTAYRIVVNEPGTRAGFQNAITAIAAQIQPEDLLLIHTNNHGGGPGDGVADFCLCAQDAANDWAAYFVNDFIADLGNLPGFEVLMVMMEQCRSGGFINPIINNSPAVWTHVVTAVAAADYSLGGANFDPFAEDWIAALAGQYPNGGALTQVVDTNNDGRLSSAEIYHYADAVHSFGDTPQSSETPAGVDEFIFFGLPNHDLFLRDNLQDHGREPLIGGGICASPDIIVFNQELLDPDATLLTPAAQDSDTLGQNVEAGQDNFIYLRVQNRGSQATAGSATLFWAQPSVLPTPASWNQIGQITIPSVPPGEMIVAGPLKWDKADIPGKGHYCFVGLIDSGDDPAPDHTAIQTVNQFYAFIRESNNATWKNFNVDDVFANSVTNMEFHVQGWPRTHMAADLVVNLTELPGDFEVRLRILRRLSEDATKAFMSLEEQTTLYQRLRIDCGREARLNGMPLKPSDDTQATLEVTVPEGAIEGAYRISVAQVVDGREVGRVTRMLAVGDHPFMANSRSLEVHIPGCVWADRISPRHRLAYDSMERALRHGFNGCHYCLEEYSTD